MLTFNM